MPTDQEFSRPFRYGPDKDVLPKVSSTSRKEDARTSGVARTVDIRMTKTREKRLSKRKYGMKNEELEIRNSLKREEEEIVAHTICHPGQVDIKTNLNFQSIALKPLNGFLPVSPSCRIRKERVAARLSFCKRGRKKNEWDGYALKSWLESVNGTCKNTFYAELDASS